MAMSDWVKDLRALAAARRDRGQPWLKDFQELMAAGRANDAASNRLSFADDCELFKSYAERGVDSKVEATSSELGLVARITNTVAEIMERLEVADPSARTSVLVEYGLRTSAEIDQPRLKRMRAATDELRSKLNPAVWYISPQDERQRYATEARAALQRFLAACQ